jgi:hypothetical protein
MAAVANAAIADAKVDVKVADDEVADAANC